MSKLIYVIMKLKPVYDEGYQYELVMPDGTSISDGILQIAPNWVSVEDKLPEAGTEILICDRVPRFSIAIYDAGEFFYGGTNMTRFVTHWMPLPEPPEAE